MYTLLSLVQEFCGARALNVPSAVMSSVDPQVIQIRRLIEEGLDLLSKRGQWQGLTCEAAIVTLAAEDQGLISSLATNAYVYALPYTFWDRTNKIALVGPMDAQDWQAMKAWIVTGPRYQMRLRGNHLFVTPPPTAGLDWRFEYISANWLAATGSQTGSKRRFTADDDVILLPEEVVSADIRWRWKKEKGIAFAQDFADCELLVVNALGRDAGIKKDLDMCAANPDAVPGISVPLFTNITRP